MFVPVSKQCKNSKGRWEPFCVHTACLKCEWKLLTGTKPPCDSILPLSPLWFFTFYVCGIYPLLLPNCSVNLCFTDAYPCHFILTISPTSPPHRWAFLSVPLQHYSVKAVPSLSAGRGKWSVRQHGISWTVLVQRKWMPLGIHKHS